MTYSSLDIVIEKLKASPRVKGIFLTGSISALKPESDLDVVIILDKNTEQIKSLYTTIEGRFADIFFFGQEFLEQLDIEKEISGNSLAAIFLNWLDKAKIVYDPKRILENLRSKKLSSKIFVPDYEKRQAWVNVNYNFIAAKRYFTAVAPLYRSALELRLMYSVMELVTAYFTFRDIPWRGEKTAVGYFQHADPDYFSIFNDYLASTTSEERMRSYEALFKKTLFRDYQQWPQEFSIAVSLQPKKDILIKSLEYFWS